MKSLDEVIKALEICTSVKCNCEDCPYYDECGIECRARRNEEIIYYLKELKEARDIITTAREEAMIQLENFKADIMNKLADNPPLTWDELKQMEGKPVWVEYGKDFCMKSWGVIFSFTGRTIDDSWMHLEGGYPNMFLKADLGKTWQAYRKERE